MNFQTTNVIIGNYSYKQKKVLKQEVQLSGLRWYIDSNHSSLGNTNTFSETLKLKLKLLEIKKIKVLKNLESLHK